MRLEDVYCQASSELVTTIRGNNIFFSLTCSPATKNTTMTTCGAPVRSRVVLGRTVGIVLGVASALFVLIRIGYKVAVSRAELGWDDYFIVITLLFGIPNTIIIDRGAFRSGLGVDTWTLPFDTITNFVRFFYVMEILYFLDLALLKLSLLFFYQRIFPAREVRRVIWATIAFNCAFGVTFVIVAIFQCQPISYYWTSWDGEHQGKCISINGLGWANAAISIGNAYPDPLETIVLTSTSPRSLDASHPPFPARSPQTCVEEEDWCCDDVLRGDVVCIFLLFMRNWALTCWLLA
jgi:hypothetical protein